ncbi:lipid-transfer protein [Pseudohalioglobus sediminis]|uniref:Lipid-transfer protein n=1 Tax=Pseudohalioglobus sediminis TaxID=2606449 RepID=A0A5B0X1H8_9GAMM|nr:thiolase domain-containing protein [Pseudohalioglobus sediminis]KAA1193170.1 lipid-transfer protein [Pseudohalioglobus sediminis]
MRDIAIVAYHQSRAVADAGACNEVEMIMPVLNEVYGQVGINNAQDVDFVCSGSCDYMQGAAFAFVAGVDALGAVPPIKESHVEMDAAWALYESILKIRMGSAESALIYGFGKSSPGELPIVLSQQLDPYYLAPQWIDTVSLAAMQARLLLEQGVITERDMAAVVSRSRRNARQNPNAQLAGDISVDDVLAEETYLSPLRRVDCCPVSDGAAAMIICTEDKAREWGVPYALIRGIDHRIETHHIGMRDLTDSASTRLAAERAGVGDGPVDVAELYAPFSHQELILARALGLGEQTDINPSGGVLAGNLMMASGLARVGEVFNRIVAGEAQRGVAHATSGPCLQHNLVTVVEKA